MYLINQNSLHLQPSRRRLFTSCALAAAMVAPATGAMAQDEGSVSEIIVTAQRRAERLENVPMSVTAISPESIEKAGVTSIHDLSRLVAGAQINFAGCCTQPAVRGISTLTTGLGFENNVAIYLDGFYAPDNISINGDLANIAGVEVLKGPQGTLWGRNATGGAILITTKAPSKVLTGDFQVGYGRYDEKIASAYLSGPINDRMRASIAAYGRKTDGYNKQVDVTGRVIADLTPITQVSARAKLEIDVTDKLKATLGYNYGLSSDGRGNNYPVDAQPASFLPGPPQRSVTRYRLSTNYKPVAQVNMSEGTLTLAYQTPVGNVTSYTGFARRRTTSAFDFDASVLDLIASKGYAMQDTFQQGLDFNLTAVDKLDLVVGGYYYHDALKQLHGYSIANFRITGDSQWTLKTEAWAVYADGTYHFTDKLSLNAGARYSHDNKDVHNFALGPTLVALSVPFREAQASFNAFTPRVSLRYELAPRTNVYAAYSKGYRTGGFNPTPGPPLVEYAPEKITSYEVGFKTARGNLRFDAAAFYYDYRDLQVGVTIPNPNPAVGGVLNLTLNANKAEVYGVDTDVTYSPVEHLNLHLGLAYLHGRYRNFPNATGVGINPVTNTNVTQVQDWSDLQMARAPKWSGNASIDYEFQDVLGGKLLTAASVTYTDKFPMSNPSVYGPLMPPSVARIQRFVDQAHTLLNLHATWRDSSDHYRVTAWVNNVTDVRYRLTYNGNAANGTYASPAEPRTYGVRLGYSF